MNGRVYDYNLGRFLSVDPFIQEPGNSQSMNPYSYIMNNPLAGTDPSGYLSCSESELDSCMIGEGETAEITNEDGEVTSTITNNKDGSVTYNIATDNGKQVKTYHREKGSNEAHQIGGPKDVSNASEWLSDFSDKANAANSDYSVDETTMITYGDKRANGRRRVTNDGSNPDGGLNPEVVKLYEQYLVNLGVAPGKLLTGSLTNAANLRNPTSQTLGITKYFKNGKVPKASEIEKYAKNQGWERVQTANGPIKYVDSNGIVRVTIKKGSVRAPGSGKPHVEIRSSQGKRIDPKGNPATRKGQGNHTEIEYDL